LNLDDDRRMLPSLREFLFRKNEIGNPFWLRISLNQPRESHSPTQQCNVTNYNKRACDSKTECRCRTCNGIQLTAIKADHDRNSNRNPIKESRCTNGTKRFFQATTRNAPTKKCPLCACSPLCAASSTKVLYEAIQ